MADVAFKPGHHSPPHLFAADWLYMLTGAVYKQQPLLQSDNRKREWLDAFFKAAELYQWIVIAWVVMDNHYHAILRSPEKSAENLPKFVASYHKFTSRKWNDQENTPGRMVWWNYWDTCIRSQEDYLNRLRYIFWNPVKHGLVHDPRQYKYSNYLDFLEKEWLNFDQTKIKVEDVPEF